MAVTNTSAELKVGMKVRPSIILRSWGASAIDKGGIITKVTPSAVRVRPLKSTRHKEIGCKGFGWLWSSKQSYHFAHSEVEVLE